MFIHYMPIDMLPQSGNRKKPVTKTTVRVDPPKWLEMALAVDHTVRFELNFYARTHAVC